MPSDSKHVVMFVVGSFTHDARVTREARTLAESGMKVTVLAVRGDPSLPLREEMHGFTVERLVFTGRFYGAVGESRKRTEESRLESREGLAY
jgi:hypothetical protein